MSDQIPLAFARCFVGPNGQVVLDHLKSLTLERALGPEADDRLLRHLEGQRQLVVYIQGLIERGRNNPNIHAEN